MSEFRNTSQKGRKIKRQKNQRPIEQDVFTQELHPITLQLQRAIDNPTQDSLTPEVVRALLHTHGNAFVQRLVTQSNQHLLSQKQESVTTPYIQRRLDASQEMQLRSVIDDEYGSANIPPAMIIIIHQYLSRVSNFEVAFQAWRDMISLPNFGLNLTNTVSVFSNDNQELRRLLEFITKVSSNGLVINIRIIGNAVLGQLIRDFKDEDAFKFITIAQGYAADEQEALQLFPLQQKLKDFTKLKTLTERISAKPLFSVIMELLDTFSYEEIHELTQVSQLNEILATVDRAAIILKFLAHFPNDKPAAVALALDNCNDDDQRLVDLLGLLTSYPDKLQNIAELLLMEGSIVRVETLLNFLGQYPGDWRPAVVLALGNCNNDDQRLADLLDLLTSYPDKLQDVTDALQEDGTIASAREEMRLRMMYEFDPEFLGMGKDLGKQAGEKTTKEAKQQAKTTYDQTYKNLTKDLSKAALGRITGGSSKKTKPNKGEQAIATQITTAKATLQQEELTAETKGQQVKKQTIDKIGQFVQDNKGQMSVVLLKELIRLTGDDTVLATHLKDVMLLQHQIDDLTLVNKILQSKVESSKLAITCQGLLRQHVNEEKCWIIAEFIATCPLQDACNWLTTEAPNVASDELLERVQFLKKHDKHITNALNVLRTLGIGGLEYESEGPILSLKEGDLNWLLTLSGVANYVQLIRYVVDKPKEVLNIQALWVYNTTHQNYPLQAIVNWMRQKNPAKVLEALQTTSNWENLVELIDAYLAYDASPQSKQQFLFLVRLDAISRSPGGLALTVYQRDVNYAGSQDPPSRTGFLEYNFANGDRAEIHTHWNTSKKRLVSMHIQDASGQNGLEINQWKFFDRVQSAVRDGHNAAGGLLAPTTNPVGGQLAL